MSDNFDTVDYTGVGGYVGGVHWDALEGSGEYPDFEHSHFNNALGDMYDDFANDGWDVNGTGDEVYDVVQHTPITMDAFDNNDMNENVNSHDVEDYAVTQHTPVTLDAFHNNNMNGSVNGHDVEDHGITQHSPIYVNAIDDNMNGNASSSGATYYPVESPTVAPAHQQAPTEKAQSPVAIQEPAATAQQPDPIQQPEVSQQEDGAQQPAPAHQPVPQAPIYAPYQGLFQTASAAKAHRNRIRTAGIQDPNIHNVKTYRREYWVKQIYEAMISVNNLVDNLSSVHLKRFTLVHELDPSDLEAAAHHVFEKAIAVHERGWTRPSVYHREAIRGKLADQHKNNVEARLATICETMRVSKAACNDALQGGLSLARLVHNPDQRKAGKEGNNVGNVNKAQRLKEAAPKKRAARKTKKAAAPKKPRAKKGQAKKKGAGEQSGSAAISTAA